MNSEIPKKIEKVGTTMLKCEFRDTETFVIKLEDLRTECPCASCKPDAFHYSNQKATMLTIGKNDLVELKIVGNYALAARWADGHDTGIYPFKLFRKIFENYNLSEDEIAELKKKAPAKPIPQLNIRQN